MPSGLLKALHEGKNLYIYNKYENYYKKEFHTPILHKKKYLGETLAF